MEMEHLFVSAEGLEKLWLNLITHSSKLPTARNYGVLHPQYTLLDYIIKEKNKQQKQ